jgi:hypothetical protein
MRRLGGADVDGKGRSKTREKWVFRGVIKVEEDDGGN